MPSISHLRSEARKVGQGSNDPNVSKLAEIVEQICGVCDELEQKIKQAHEEAKRAKREARK